MKTAAGRVTVPVRSERMGIGLSLSPREWEALRLYAELGDQHAAAHEMGISYQTFKNHLTAVYRLLGASSAINAYRVLGWLDTDRGLAAASLADIEARLAAIHAESGALLAELRSAA